jgi:hypothetical protein
MSAPEALVFNGLLSLSTASTLPPPLKFWLKKSA